jgi:hypothetical protein
VTPDTMPRIATISDRYLSYNVEMAEVIGGSFWKPYDEQSESTRRVDPAPATSSSSSGAAGLQAGQDPSMFEVRPPIDLDQPALAQVGGGAGTRLRPGERHVGEHRLLP